MQIHLKTTFYSSCIPEDVLAQVSDFFDAADQQQVTKKIQELFDYVALRTVLTHLDSDADKISFLEVFRDEYATSSPLDWAVLKSDNIHVRLQEALERNLLALYQKLQSVQQTS